MSHPLKREQTKGVSFPLGKENTSSLFPPPDLGLTILEAVSHNCLLCLTELSSRWSKRSYIVHCARRVEEGGIGTVLVVIDVLQTKTLKRKKEGMQKKEHRRVARGSTKKKKMLRKHNAGEAESSGNRTKGGVEKKGEIGIWKRNKKQ